jgi:hypothetical protein
MRAALIAAVLIAACIAPGHRRLAEPNAFTSDEYGFKIDRPEAK